MAKKVGKGELTAKERRARDKRKEEPRPHGGAREGSGRKSLFPGKNPQPVSVLLTDEEKVILDDRVAAVGYSRNDIVGGLLRRNRDITRKQLEATARAEGVLA